MWCVLLLTLAFQPEGHGSSPIHGVNFPQQEIYLCCAALNPGKVNGYLVTLDIWYVFIEMQKCLMMLH